MMKFDWSAYTVLIAEDDAMSYRFLEVILTKQTKLNIIWAIDGKQAVEYCRQFKHIDVFLWIYSSQSWMVLRPLNTLNPSSLIYLLSFNQPIR
ncbi:MAG: hypothetical protein HC906_17875 [Bacteroidales bacterium]|nr:hypothetical protein [Bacteroidales bacterium]